MKKRKLIFNELFEGLLPYILTALISLACYVDLSAQGFGRQSGSPNDDLVSYQVNDDGSAAFREEILYKIPGACAP
jgi:hypothetical protein